MDYNNIIKEYLKNGMKYIDRNPQYKFICTFMEMLKNNCVHSIYPLWVGLKVTSQCNCNCVHCWVEKKQYNPTFDNIVCALDKLKEMEIMHVTITGGEPFLRDDIMLILEQVKKRRFHLEIFTNASLLDNNKINELKNIMDDRDYIQVSFDASNQHIFNLQRVGCDYDTVLNNIRQLVDNNINVRLNFTATPINQFDIEKAFIKAVDLNVKSFSLSHVFDVNKGENLYDQVNKLTFLKQIGKCIVRSQKCNMEFRPFIPIEFYANQAKIENQQKHKMIQNKTILDWFIHSDGSIYPDVTLEYPLFYLGNIYSDTIMQINENIKKKENLFYYRNLSNTKCSFCNQYEFCKGGEKGRSYKIYKDINYPDPRCNAFEENNEKR